MLAAEWKRPVWKSSAVYNTKLCGVRYQTCDGVKKATIQTRQMTSNTRHLVQREGEGDTRGSGGQTSLPDTDAWHSVFINLLELRSPERESSHTQIKKNLLRGWGAPRTKTDDDKIKEL